MAKRKQTQRCGTTSESMIAFSCVCGFRWHNEKLKGKTDEALIVERDEAFMFHVDAMEQLG